MQRVKDKLKHLAFSASFASYDHVQALPINNANNQTIVDLWFTTTNFHVNTTEFYTTIYSSTFIQFRIFIQFIQLNEIDTWRID